MTAPLFRIESAYPPGAALEVHPAPALSTGFREAARYVLTAEAVVADEVLVDDEPLPSAGEGRWAYTPGFYAGTVRGVARRGGRDVASFLIDVSPHPDKLGREVFDAMVDRLFSFDPAFALGTEPGTRPVGTIGRRAHPLVQLERLRRNGPLFIAAFDRVRARPRAGLVHRREEVSAERLRHADRTTVLAALHRRDALACLTGRSPDDGAAARFDVPQTEETLDCAPNRAMAARVRELRARIARLLRHGERINADPSDARTSLVARWPERSRALTALDASLARLQRLRPLAEVTRPEVTAAGLTAIQADPAYARAWRLAGRALRTSVDGDPEDRQALSPTWEVYERWSYLEVAAREEAATPGSTWREAAGRVAGARCDHALVGESDSTRVAVLYQPRFPSRPTATLSPGPSSISLLRVPDIVVLRFDAEILVSWSAFDAKYRSGRRNVLDAMTSAHVYRDALRWSGMPPREALLLVPTLTGVERLASPEYIAKHKVGLAVCAPTGPAAS